MRIAVFLPALLLALAPAVGRAQGGDPAGAEALFREGRQAADAGNYAVACPKFEESYRLDPAPGTLLNLADCEENRGQLARAWQHFRQLSDQLPPDDDRKPVAEARARALAGRAPKLRIVLMVSVPATVTRDGIVLGGASLGTSLPVDPGRHNIVVSAAGRREKRYEVWVGEGDEKEVSVSSGEALPDIKAPVVLSEARTPPSSVAAPVSVLAPRETIEPTHGDARRTAGFVVGGVGAASILVGSVFGVVALSQLSSANAGCTGNVCANQGAVDQFHGAQSFAVAADVSVGLGVALLATGIVLVLIAPRAPSTHAASAAPIWMGGRF